MIERVDRHELQAGMREDLFAADFAMMSGELAHLLEHLTEALGGEAQ